MLITQLITHPETLMTQDLEKSAWGRRAFLAGCYDTTQKAKELGHEISSYTY